MASWTPTNFNETCLRAAGRRAYNRKRRLERAARITRILELQDQDRRKWKGRELAVLLGVHEATISRDLKFIAGVRKHYRDMTGGLRMTSRSFRWLRGAQGYSYEILFEMSQGVRIR